MTPVKGRWGYYPCTYELYCKLKRLNFLALCARKRHAVWERWDRKFPENRVSHPPKGTPNRRKTALAPLPEPVLAPDGLYGLSRDYIEESYRAARYPVNTPEEVIPIKFSEDRISKLLTEAELWYASPAIV
jgi:hypothetical protein